MAAGDGVEVAGAGFAGAGDVDAGGGEEACGGGGGGGGGVFGGGHFLWIGGLLGGLLGGFTGFLRKVRGWE